MLDPSPAQVPVQIDEACEAVQPSRHERQLRVVQAGLCREHGEIVVHAVLEANLRQVERALLGVGVAFDRRDLVVVRSARCKAIGHFAECALDRLGSKGPEDYITKPFGPRELLARVRAL
jgi:CheY-like chemotaxis protein